MPDPLRPQVAFFPKLIRSGLFPSLFAKATWEKGPASVFYTPFVPMYRVYEGLSSKL